MRNNYWLVSFIPIIFCILCSGLQAKDTTTKTQADSSNKQLFKPFKSNQNNEKANAQEQYASIWTRMRKKFTLHVPDNHARVKFYLKKYSQNPAYINELVNNSYPFLHYIVEEIEKNGLPAELALLPMVESTFDPHAKSPSGAIGLWQIMPRTGKYFGLHQEQQFEGCRDIHASTTAALTHLNYLQQRFKGDWLLALAAYNSGEGKVQRAIKRNKQAHKATDFWSLNLPKETTDYIPKLLALVEIVKRPSHYGVSVPNIPNKPYFVRIDNDKAIELVKLAEHLKISKHEIYRLNPAHICKHIHPDAPKHILVPTHVATQTKSVIKNIPAYKPVKPTKYVVKKGDTLGKIAQEHQTTIKSLQELNKLSTQTIKIGTELDVPSLNTKKTSIAKLSSKNTETKTATNNKKQTVHIVKNGDSLWKLSKDYKIPMQNIAMKNNLSSKSILKPGQQILIEV
jgi:membrane-bound lytic murein transglycosylase D